MVMVLVALVAADRFAGLVEDFRRALVLADVSLKAAAIDMDIDHALLIRQMQGQGHFSWARFSRIQSEEFHQWFSLLRAVRTGMPNEVEVAAALKPRMARMALLSLSTEKEQRA
jgi:hypothetical protein